ncbi:hypothetical protein GQ600_23125 [Phytophthora cactorum]|nr:hypothetical protein GQ600_23125 [Phytophthora cactorum]
MALSEEEKIGHTQVDKMARDQTQTLKHGGIYQSSINNEYVSAFKSKIGETIVQFDDITRFAGEMWLSDGCVFVAALKVADSWIHKQDHGRINQVHVVDFRLSRLPRCQRQRENAGH